MNETGYFFLHNTVGGLKTSPSFSFIGDKPNLSKFHLSLHPGHGDDINAK